ncbi:Sulfotransferase [Gracilaria domingensis]|nr:Sulfotransferase [Gracilaria domingensis]
MSLSPAESQADSILRAYFRFLYRLRDSYNDPAENVPIHDVVIASSVGSGSNLTQHLVYQLLTAAGRVPTDPDRTEYADTTGVVPVTELRTAMNLHEPLHRSHPQVWKTHLVATPFLKHELFGKRRFIYCLRNPLDVCRSFLDFTGEWFTGMALTDPSVREAIYPRYFMEYFIESKRLSNGSYPETFEKLGLWFRHVKTWTENDAGNTLYLIYEDVIKDIPETIRTVAKFPRVSMTEEQLKRVISRCDRTWMANNPRTKAHILSNAFGLIAEKSSRTRRLDSPSFRDIELPAFCKRACWSMFYDAVGAQTYEELVEQMRERNVKLLQSLHRCNS